MDIWYLHIFTGEQPTQIRMTTLVLVRSWGLQNVSKTCIADRGQSCNWYLSLGVCRSWGSTWADRTDALMPDIHRQNMRNQLFLLYLRYALNMIESLFLLYLTCLDVSLSKFEGHPTDTPNRYQIDTQPAMRLSEISRPTNFLFVFFRRYPICVSPCYDVLAWESTARKTDKKTGTRQPTC